MKISYKKNKNQTAELQIFIEPKDYTAKVEEATNNIRKNYKAPGFRPGKAPVTLLQKQHGTSIIADTVSKLVDNAMKDYITKEKIEFLGYPLPKADHKVDIEKGKEWTFIYEIGLRPEVDLKLSTWTTLEEYVIKLEGEYVSKRMKEVLQYFQTQKPADTITENSVIFIELLEIQKAAESETKPISKSSRLQLNTITNLSVKNKLIGLQKDSKVTVNISDLFTTLNDKVSNLGVSKEEAESISSDFEITVTSIGVMVDSELNQELFDKVFGPNVVTNEAEFKTKLKESSEKNIQQDLDMLFYDNAKEILLDKCKPTLPSDFLKRWILQTNEKPITQEQLDKEYPNYEQSMKWNLVTQKLVKDHNIKVTEQEIFEEVKAYLKYEYSKMGYNMPDEDLESIVKKQIGELKQKGHIEDSIIQNKIKDLLKTACKVKKKEINHAEYLKLFESIKNKKK